MLRYFRYALSNYYARTQASNAEKDIYTYGVLAPMLPFVLPERANVPPEDGESIPDNFDGRLLTGISGKMGGCDPLYHCRWHRLDHP